MRIIKWNALVSLLLFSILSFADDSATELAKKSQNPVENMISVPIDNDFNYGYGPNRLVQYNMYLKPVIPFELNDRFNLITRTIITLNHQPNLYPRRDYINGIGDLNPSLFLSPAHPAKVIWGIGPTIFLPTATNKQIGQGKYTIGPSLVVLTMPGPWVIGFLTYNAWSVAGDANRANVNEFELQYFINYNFPKGWYVTSQPIITANWMADAKNRWTLPFGLGGGRVFSIAKQPVNMSLQSYANLKTSSAIGPDWQLQLNISLLFPK